MPSIVDAVYALAGLTLGAATFYWTFARPERKRRQRFFDEALGHDGHDGMPRRDSIFERFDKVEQKLAAPLLNGQGERLIDTVGRLDTRTERLDSRTARQGRELAEIRRVLNLPHQRKSAD